MLPPFIIEQIRRLEEEERLRRDAERPRVEIPVDAFPPAGDPGHKRPEEDDIDRGMVILDLG